MPIPNTGEQLIVEREEARAEVGLISLTVGAACAFLFDPNGKRLK